MGWLGIQKILAMVGGKLLGSFPFPPHFPLTLVQNLTPPSGKTLSANWEVSQLPWEVLNTGKQQSVHPQNTDEQGVFVSK